MNIELSKYEKLKLEFVSKILNMSLSDCIKLMIQDSHTQILKTDSKVLAVSVRMLVGTSRT